MKRIKKVYYKEGSTELDFKCRSHHEQGMHPYQFGPNGVIYSSEKASFLKPTKPNIKTLGGYLPPSFEEHSLPKTSVAKTQTTTSYSSYAAAIGQKNKETKKIPSKAEGFQKEDFPSLDVYRGSPVTSFPSRHTQTPGQRTSFTTSTSPYPTSVATTTSTGATPEIIQSTLVTPKQTFMKPTKKFNPKAKAFQPGSSETSGGYQGKSKHQTKDPSSRPRTDEASQEVKKFLRVLDNRIQSNNERIALAVQEISLLGEAQKLNSVPLYQEMITYYRKEIKNFEWEIKRDQRTQAKIQSRFLSEEFSSVSKRVELRPPELTSPFRGPTRRQGEDMDLYIPAEQLSQLDPQQERSESNDDSKGSFSEESTPRYQYKGKAFSSSSPETGSLDQRAEKILEYLQSQIQENTYRIECFVKEVTLLEAAYQLKSFPIYQEQITYYQDEIKILQRKLENTQKAQQRIVDQLSKGFASTPKPPSYSGSSHRYVTSSSSQPTPSFPRKSSRSQSHLSTSGDMFPQSSFPHTSVGRGSLPLESLQQTPARSGLTDPLSSGLYGGLEGRRRQQRQEQRTFDPSSQQKNTFDMR